MEERRISAGWVLEDDHGARAVLLSTHLFLSLKIQISESRFRGDAARSV
jgi:hypothetical protein